ncbi:hypothetical protein OS242_17430 [Tumebacillus sp. DT12]|uniref:Uncharacterized protein n=1 Tax=Tumebacillus lacus TaxID=2995335 RepID=A0ABT3X4A4_9BACL|nr:hypothetical protein [Tumebacillus lacus]MCX7571728.1 hypothetical protein [Tumebacillus lacus]
MSFRDIFKSDSITKYVGFCLILIGMCRAFGVTTLDPVSQFGFSLSACFFTLADFWYYNYDRSQKLKVKKLTKLGFDSGKLYFWAMSTFQFFAVCSIIVIPYLYTIITNKSFLSLANDVTLLLGLGIVVSLIGIRRDHAVDEKIREVSSLMDQGSSDPNKVFGQIKDILDPEKLVEEMKKKRFSGVDNNTLSEIIKNLSETINEEVSNIERISRIHLEGKVEQCIGRFIWQSEIGVPIRVINLHKHVLKTQRGLTMKQLMNELNKFEFAKVIEIKKKHDGIYFTKIAEMKPLSTVMYN